MQSSTQYKDFIKRLKVLITKRLDLIITPDITASDYSSAKSIM